MNVDAFCTFRIMQISDFTSLPNHILLISTQKAHDFVHNYSHVRPLRSQGMAGAPYFLSPRAGVPSFLKGQGGGVNHAQAADTWVITADTYG